MRINLDYGVDSYWLSMVSAGGLSVALGAQPGCGNFSLLVVVGLSEFRC